MKFKVNDKVRILGKNRGKGFNSNDPNLKWRIGDIAYIQNNDKFGIFLKKTPNDILAEWGVFAEEDLELVQDLKVGDKVEILNKSAGDINRWFGWKIGDIGIIRNIGGVNHYINTLEGEEKKGAFRDYDLRLIEEVKYKFITEFTPFDLISNSPASIVEKDKFNKKMVEMGYGLYDIIDMNLEFYNYFTQHDCFIKYLLENNFIEEENTFKSFKITFDVTNKEEFKVLYDAIGDCSYFYSEWNILNKKEKEIS